MTPLYGLSLDLVTFIGTANVAYALPGLSLTLLRVRPPWLLALLVAANLAWTLVCCVLAVHVYILGEGVYVAVLAFLEVRQRRAFLSLSRPDRGRCAQRDLPSAYI